MYDEAQMCVYVYVYVCMQHFLLRLVYPPDNQRRINNKTFLPFLKVSPVKTQTLIFFSSEENRDNTISEKRLKCLQLMK